jgi:hypothetical protein
MVMSISKVEVIMINFEPQLEQKPLPKIPLPNGWSDLVLLALLHVITLARLAIMNACYWLDGSEMDFHKFRISEYSVLKTYELLRCSTMPA